MKVTDIFSWLPAQEISLEELEEIFIEYNNGVYKEDYKVLLKVPNNAGRNIVDCTKELIEEGKNIACLTKEKDIIAIIGYKE